MKNDDLMDAIADLYHDLGKYLRLPFSMLPKEADQSAVLEALDTALNRTRTGPRGVRSAREIWEGFTAEAGASFDGNPAFAALSEAVKRALAWERLLDGRARDPDRAVVEADLRAVAERIRVLMQEVAGD